VVPVSLHILATWRRSKHGEKKSDMNGLQRFCNNNDGLGCAPEGDAPVTKL
jgi:hypothetical protein